MWRRKPTHHREDGVPTFSNGSAFASPSLPGAEQAGAGAARQAILRATAAGAQEETPGSEAQRGAAACGRGGEAPAEAERGEGESGASIVQSVLQADPLIQFNSILFI